MTDEATKRLEMRIVELENTIKSLVEARQPVDITPAEYQTYLKVKGIVEGYQACMVACMLCLAGCVRLCFVFSPCVPCAPGGHGGNPGGFGSLGG
jgi:hypothetical protein